MQFILSVTKKWPKKIFSLFFPRDATSLGTFNGVYIPSVLMMLGVILYLRLGWITGNVGAAAMTGIISLSLLIMILTSLSMTSIVSNMKIGGGGAYYMISRSLGIELGSAVGIALYVCQCVSASLCVSGFAESLHHVMPEVPIRLIEIVSLTSLAALSLVSTNIALSTQFFIFILLGTSFFSIFSGSGAHLPAIENPALPVIGFWGAFSMFYPAMTGVEVGMAMSGTLKNPAKSLPIGIISSLLTVFVIYLGLSLFLSYSASREQLISDTFIVYKIASFPQLIMIGIWGATLSSALSCLLGAPRMLQAISEDGVFPKIFAKTYGKQLEPRIASATTFLLALLINLFTTINQIIPLVAMICLISYGSLNFVVYLEEILRNPSWRPGFRIHWLLPLLGAFGCLCAMWMINPMMTIVGFLVVITIYAWVSRKNIQSDFQDMRYSLLFYIYKKVTCNLARLVIQPRNWRPNILALVQSPLSRQNLIHFSHSLTQGKGYLVFASIFPDYFHDNFPLDAAKKVFEDFLDKKKIPSLVEVCSLKQGYQGVSELVKAYSFGVLQPNTVLLSEPEATSKLEFVRTLFEIRKCQKNILIFKDSGNENSSIFCEKLSVPKTIDIWWEGQNRLNLDLIFSLVSLLRSDPVWKKAKATVKMIVESEQAKENLESYFKGFLARNRIQLDFHIYQLSGYNDAFEMIEYLSQKSDLIFLGLKDPAEDVEETPYVEYYDSLVAKTSNIKNVIYVLHGENINLRDMWDFDVKS